MGKWNSFVWWMRGKLITGWLLILTWGIGHGQVPKQDVSGIVRDAISFEPIANVSVLLTRNDAEFGATTDSSGRFTLSGIPIGRYHLKVTHIGYAFATRDVLVEAGKEFYINIDLNPAPVVLAGVEIRPEPDLSSQSLSSLPFNMDLAERVPATFYDPARIVTGFPGVAVQNDQANNISVRGNTPNHISWRINGLNFVNPNHLTNAGTMSDRPSVSGGGVAILSAQLIGDSRLLTGAFPPEYGNALAGVFDMALREGNKNQQEYTLQAGVLGIEAAMEGPFSREKDHSYLLNYRYSTVGILSGLGVDLGEEAITFQDLSFITGLDLKKSGRLTVFGLGGISTEKFSAERDSSQWTFFEDRVDTRFDSDMGGLGITHQINLDDRSSLTSGVAWSLISSTRNSEYVQDDYLAEPYEKDAYTTGLLSLHMQYQRNLNGTVLRAGIYSDNQQFNILSTTAPPDEDTLITHMSGEGNYWVHQPYASLSGSLLPRVGYSLGLNFLYHSLRNRTGLGPRISLDYAPGDRHVLRLQYGLVHATQIPQAYYVHGDPSDAFPNISLGLTASHQAVVGYELDLSSYLGIILEGFYQYHMKVPVSPDVNSTYSVVNAQDAFIDEPLINEGLARNAGIELSLDHAMHNGNYFMVNASIYDSRYAALDGKWRNTRFNGRYALTLTGGREFRKVREEKERIIGINGRVLLRGGFRQTPIDEDASRLAGEAVYMESIAFSRKLEDYFRLDAGIYFKKHKQHYTRTLLIGIQNLTNRKNIAYLYFDRERNRITAYNQLGIIPNISYRVEF